MPRYDYRCRACGETFEVTRSISATTTIERCPAGHDDTVRLLSTVGMNLKRERRESGGGCGCGGACGCGGH
jgi:putative FmdB family regulatory protein